MDRYFINPRSSNPVTGPIMVTTSSRKTCPRTCPLKPIGHSDLTCYAEKGFLGGFVWAELDNPASRFRAYDFHHLISAITALPEGTVWRHNQAGDLPTTDNTHIDRERLDQIVEANRGRRGFTFTHYSVHIPHNRFAVNHANRNGFRINISVDSLYEADAVAGVTDAPIAVVIKDRPTRPLFTPKGRRVVICPNRTHKVTCSTCQLCTRARNTIVALPAI